MPVPARLPSRSAASSTPTQHRSGTSLTGVDLARSGRLPISMLAGRIPTAQSTAEVAVSQAFLRRVGVTKERSADVLGTEVEVSSSSSRSRSNRTSAMTRVYYEQLPLGRASAA